MVAICIFLPVKKALFLYAVVNILLSIYNVIIVSINGGSVVGVLITLFFIDMAFSSILLYGLHKDDVAIIKIYYASLFVAMSVLVCFIINGFVLNIIISVFNLAVRIYVLYMVTKLIAEMQAPGHPTI